MSLDIQVKLWLGHQNIHIEILCTMWFQISNLMNVEWESDHGSSEGEEEESLWKANLSKQGPLFKAGQLLQHQPVELNENKLPPSWSFHCWLAEKQLTKQQKHFGHFVLNLDSCPILNDRFIDCWTKIPLNCGSNFIQYFPHLIQANCEVWNPKECVKDTSGTWNLWRKEVLATVMIRSMAIGNCPVGRFKGCLHRLRRNISISRFYSLALQRMWRWRQIS